MRRSLASLFAYLPRPRHTRKAHGRSCCRTGSMGQSAVTASALGRTGRSLQPAMKPRTSGVGLIVVKTRPASAMSAGRPLPWLTAERYRVEHLPHKSKQSQHDDGVMVGHILKHIGSDRRVAEVHHGDIVA